jgi:FkbM family methyltransferase
MDIRIGNRIIRLAGNHSGYADEVRQHFEMFFNATEYFVEGNALVVDYSWPRVHKLRGFGEFEFSSLPEEPEAIDGYLAHYKLKPTDVVFDCGAYCGATTINFAKRAKHVFAFEPDSKNRAALVRNLVRHKVENVTVLPYALAGQNGTETFNSESTPGSALPRCNGRASFDGISTVETITLASAFERYGVPDFIKLDIEGAEVEVLDTSRDLLRGKLIPIAIDTNHPLPDGRMTREVVEPLLRVLGYEMAESSTEFGGYWMTQAVPKLRVLVVVPTHDRLDFLSEALESLDKQTRKADQVTVTGNVGQGIITNAPLAHRINQAIEQSDCDAFILLCDDDALAPGYIEKTVALMASSGADIVYTDTEFFGDLSLPHYGQERTRPWSDEIDRHNIASLFSLCRKSMWRKVGGWADVPLFDWDFWWRCFHADARTAYVPLPLARYRVHAGQETYRIDINKASAQARQRQSVLRQDRSWINSHRVWA